MYMYEKRSLLLYIHIYIYSILVASLELSGALAQLRHRPDVEPLVEVVRGLDVEAAAEGLDEVILGQRHDVGLGELEDLQDGPQRPGIEELGLCRELLAVAGEEALAVADEAHEVHELSEVQGAAAVLVQGAEHALEALLGDLLCPLVHHAEPLQDLGG